MAFLDELEPFTGVDWPDRRSEAPKALKSYPIRVYAGCLPGGEHIFEVTSYRIDTRNTLGLFDRSGTVAAFNADAWSAIEVLEWIEDAAEPVED